MKNNEIKQPIPSEIADDALDTVAGGGIGTHINFMPSDDSNLVIESKELADDALDKVSGGIRDAEANSENENIKDETMLIIPIT